MFGVYFFGFLFLYPTTIVLLILISLNQSKENLFIYIIGTESKVKIVLKSYAFITGI